MTLTPEQFNKLATKEDLNNLLITKVELSITKKEFFNKINLIFKKISKLETLINYDQAAQDRFEKKEFQKSKNIWV